MVFPAQCAQDPGYWTLLASASVRCMGQCIKYGGASPSPAATCLIAKAGRGPGWLGASASALYVPFVSHVSSFVKSSLPTPHLDPQTHPTSLSMRGAL